MNTSINDKVALFCDCFGDSADTAREFFSCKDVLTISISEDDRLAAMASLVPILAGDNVKGFYIYGVCVAREFRHRGLFREIMSRAENEAKNRGASFVCLIPADDVLDATYRRFGYNTVVSATKTEADKKIVLCSKDFERFASCDEGIEKHHRNGLLKSIKENYFTAHDGEYAFSCAMGDI